MNHNRQQSQGICRNGGFATPNHADFHSKFTVVREGTSLYSQQIVRHWFPAASLERILCDTKICIGFTNNLAEKSGALQASDA
jgi:hypothetical protein